jgi:hypothetical protein
MTAAADGSNAYGCGLAAIVIGMTCEFSHLLRPEQRSAPRSGWARTNAPELGQRDLKVAAITGRPAADHGPDAVARWRPRRPFARRSGGIDARTDPQSRLGFMAGVGHMGHLETLAQTEGRTWHERPSVRATRPTCPARHYNVCAGARANPRA